MLVAHLNAGLGNRLKCLAGALRLDSTARVIWTLRMGNIMKEHHRVVVDPWSELFADADLEIPEQEFVFGKHIKYSTWRWFATAEEGLSDFKYHDMPCKEIYAYIFQKLKPSQEVQKIIDQRSGDYQIGAFVRTYSETKDDRGSPHEAMSKVVYELKRRGYPPAFVCGDNPLVYDTFRHVPNVTIFPQSGYVYGGWKDALANTIILSQCPQVITHRWSTASEIVFVYGGCRSDQELIFYS